MVPNFWVEVQYTPFNPEYKKYNLFHQLVKSWNKITAYSNISGVNMQTSPSLSVTNLASLNYNPFSGNMFNAATCDKKEDPIAYLGKPPQLITLM
jgi:hypothetical protein